MRIRNLIPIKFKRPVSQFVYEKIYYLYFNYSCRRGPVCSDNDKLFIAQFFSGCNEEFNTIPVMWAGKPGIDGSYPLPTWFKKCNFLISPGIGESTSFEHFLLSSGFNNIIMLDEECCRPFELLKLFPEKVFFLSKFLGVDTDDSYISLVDLVKQFNVNHGILQIDIEGAEWAVFENSNLDAFDILVVEFHNVHETLFNSHAHSRCKVLKSLLEEFDLVWAKPNFISPTIVFNGDTLYDLYELLLIRK